MLLALASFLTFTLASLTFSPLDSLQQRNPRPPQAVIDAKAAELNLDKPIPLRYGDWVGGAVHGDFGTTVAGQPVSDELGRRIGVSLRLLLIGSVIGTRARRAGRRLGRGAPVPAVATGHHRWLSLLISHPGLPAREPAENRRAEDQLDPRRAAFHYTGETSPDAVGGSWNQLVDRLQHLVLPTLTLALGRDRRLQPLPAQRHARRARRRTSSAPPGPRG